MASFILAIDQGTTSSRAILFDGRCKVVAVAQQEFEQHFPRSGWVEHDAEDLWKTVVSTCRSALRKARVRPKEIAGIGMTNQRETTVIWDRRSGKPVHKAIVWQDRRTAEVCAEMRKAGYEPDIAARTGLLLDPYFSGTKAQWILDNVKGSRERGRARRACLRHGGQFSHLEADRRTSACD